MPLGRVLGIDAGERRIGLALSDETRLLATPYRVVQRDKGLGPAIDMIANVAKIQNVELIVVGLPLNTDGSHGRQANRAANFAKIVGRVTELPVEMWDERYSTQDAEARIREAGGELRSHGPVDSQAAAVILQGFLDAQPKQAE